MNNKSEEIKAMNIYQKLNCVREELLETLIQKTGKNTHIKYDYYRMVDLVSAIHPLNSKYGIAYEIHIDCFNTKKGTIRLINTDNIDQVSTHSTICSVANTVRGNDYTTEDPIVQVGKTQTYMTRYLLILGYGLDSTDKTEEEFGKYENKGAKVSEKQVNVLINTIKSLKSKEKIKELFKYIGLNRKLETNEDYAKLLTDNYDDLTQEKVNKVFEFKKEMGYN